jgi:SAM-dependent methyltransferase
MEATEIRKLAALEDRHWWYRERRALLRAEVRRLEARGQQPGDALDIGAAGGGNTRVLCERGWRPIALEYSPEGAALARDRGLASVRADARVLPLRSCSVDLVTAFERPELIGRQRLHPRPQRLPQLRRLTRHEPRSIRPAA